MKKLKYLFWKIMQSKPLLSAILSFCSIVGLSSVVQARVTAIACNVSPSGVFNIIPSQSIKMNCNNRDCYMYSNTRLEYLRVVITRRGGEKLSVRLGRPPGGIRDYPSDLTHNEWVIDQLREKYALGFGDTIAIAEEDGYGILSNAECYGDEGLREKRGTIGFPIEPRRDINPDVSHCQYGEYRNGQFVDVEPSVIDYPPSATRPERLGFIYQPSSPSTNNCTERTKTCIASGRCFFHESNRYEIVKLVCLATTGRHGFTDCPNADDCAADPAVTMSTLSQQREKERARLRPRSEWPRLHSNPRSRGGLGN